jgi:hypothetical protein
MQNGNTRQFTMHPTLKDENGAKLVMSIEDTRYYKIEDTSNTTKTRTELWTRQINPDGSTSQNFVKAKVNKEGKVIYGTDGKPEIAMKKSLDGKSDVPISRQKVALCLDGNYTYINTVRDGNGNLVEKTHVSKASGRNTGEGFTSESTEEAHYELVEVFNSLEIDPTRRAFFERCMKTVERRMDDQIYFSSLLEGQNREKTEERFQKTAADTFDHIREMLTADDNAKQYFNKKQRIWLAQEFMQYAADPESGNQNPRGTCWINSSINQGMVQNPDDFARFLKEISLTGTFNGQPGIYKGLGRYTDHESGYERKWYEHLKAIDNEKEVDPEYSKGLVHFPRERFNLNREWRPLNEAKDGHKSYLAGPVQYIFEQAVTYPMRGMHSPVAGSYNESVEEIAFVTGQRYCHSNNLFERSAIKTLLRDGAYTTSNGGHMWSIHLAREGNDVVVIKDNQWGGDNDFVVLRVPVNQFPEWLKSNGSVPWKNSGGEHPKNPIDFVDGPPIGPIPDKPVPINPNSPNNPDEEREPRRRPRRRPWWKRR